MKDKKGILFSDTDIVLRFETELEDIFVSEEGMRYNSIKGSLIDWLHPDNRTVTKSVRAIISVDKNNFFTIKEGSFV